MSYDTIDDAMTMQPGAAGALLANRYRVVRQLGQGGMGSVWLAEDTQLDNKQFAIKMLPSILVSNKRAYRQLKDEALVAMKLTHPNIVTLRAFEENNGNPFLVMDYVDGETLDDYLAERGDGNLTQSRREAESQRSLEDGCFGRGIPEEDVIRILKPIAAALDYAHGEGVVHRDVKPANVMIRKDGHPFILDFGIAREIQETMTRVTGKLSSGTLLYMSPEQLNGESPKPAQDVYSFAAMAYECLKGEPPFVRGVIEDQIKNKDPEPLAGVSVAIARSVMAGLAKKPEGRPATCAAVLARTKNEGKVNARGASGSWWLTPALVLAAIAVTGVAYWRFLRVAYTDMRPKDPELTETNKVVEPVLPATNNLLSCCGDTNGLLPKVIVGTNAPPATSPDPGLAKPQDDPGPAPVSQLEPPKPDPEFVKMTNDLAGAVKERNLEYGKANLFRGSPRGFEKRLEGVDNASNHWTKIEDLYSMNEIDKMRTALYAVRKETAELHKDIKWMSENKEKRDAAVAQEDNFNKFYYDEEMTNAVLFARVRLRSEWRSVDGDVDSAKKLIDDGLFDKAKQSYFRSQSLIGSMLEDERRIEKRKKDKPVEAITSHSDVRPLEPLSMTVVAKLNGCEVYGAKMKKMDGVVTLPYKWEGSLSKGRSFGPYTVTYSDGVANYAGEFTITVNWNWPRHKIAPVELRKLRPGESPGGIRDQGKGRGDFVF